eukprot:INCI4203.2.p1 GENE.INCI4203.2~~INCI4203.2.p1  ORF type:complete len:551 (+),score=65.96 INCI4203.2:180-1832(+)
MDLSQITFAAIALLSLAFVNSAPRVVCGTQGNWRGSGAIDGYGWFEEQIDGSEPCQMHCSTRAHGTCAGVCYTSKDAQHCLCDDVRNTSKDCNRRGRRHKVCRCVVKSSARADPYWNLPATDTPRALHRVFDHLDAIASKARRGGGSNPTVLLEEIGRSLRAQFLVQGIENAAFDTNSNLSLSTLESLLRSLDRNGDGVVKVSDFPTTDDRMSVVGRKIAELAIAERLADGGYYPGKEGGFMQQPVAYQPLDSQNPKIFNASTGNFLLAPGQGSQQLVVDVRPSGIERANSLSSVSPGHLKLLSSSPRVFYFDRFISATELDILRLYFEQCQSPIAQSGGQLITLSDTTYQFEKDPCVLSQRISPEVGSRAWNALANVRRRIFAQTKVPMSYFPPACLRSSDVSESSFGVDPMDAFLTGKNDNHLHIALFRVFISDVQSPKAAPYPVPAASSAFTLFPRLALNDSNAEITRSRVVKAPGFECDMDNAAQYLRVPHLPGGAFLSYVREPTGSFTPSSVHVTCSSPSSPSALWLDQWVLGAPYQPREYGPKV